MVINSQYYYFEFSYNSFSCQECILTIIIIFILNYSRLFFYFYTSIILVVVFIFIIFRTDKPLLLFLNFRFQIVIAILFSNKKFICIQFYCCYLFYFSFVINILISFSTILLIFRKLFIIILVIIVLLFW